MLCQDFCTNKAPYLISYYFNPLRPNSDLSQTSHYNIKSLSASEVMRIENMITQVLLYEKYGNPKGEFVI